MSYSLNCRQIYNDFLLYLLLYFKKLCCHIQINLFYCYCPKILRNAMLRPFKCHPVFHNIDTQYKCIFVNVKENHSTWNSLFPFSMISLGDDSKYVFLLLQSLWQGKWLCIGSNFNTPICQNKQYKSFLSLREAWEISSLWARNESWRCISGTGYLLYRVMARPVGCNSTNAF